MSIKTVCHAMVILCSGLLTGLVGAEVLLEKIQDKNIACDYLVVCPETMGQAAQQLAQHRNSFTGDDVENAHVVYLERIVIEFTGSDFKKRRETLWQALKWARDNWRVPPAYLVLVGDDTYATDSTDSIAYSIGRMPTWFSGIKIRQDGRSFLDLTISDDYYTSISQSKPSDAYSDWYSAPLYVGRIPAQSATVCSIYVEKVKRYDLSTGDRTWRNSVIAIADDAFQGERIDQVALMTPFQTTCDRLADSCNGFFFRKKYISVFPTDQFFSKPEAKKSIISTINNGVGIAIFYGHGNKTVFTDEQILHYTDFDRFENDSTPLMMLSFTSTNGSFLTSDGETMCKRFLFKERGGCIAYFASTTETYANSNAMLGSRVLSNVTRHQQHSIGRQIFDAKKTADSEMLPGYFLLGDPALRLLSKEKLGMELAAVRDSMSAGTLSLGITDSSRSSDTFNYTIEFSYADSATPLYPRDIPFVKDSVFSVKKGSFVQNVTFDLPPLPQKPVKAVAYVWNNLADGHVQISVDSSNKASGVRRHIPQPVKSSGIIVKNMMLTLPATVTGHFGGTIKVYDFRGRLVYSMPLQNGQSRIDLSRKIASPGRYLVELKSGNVHLREPVMILR